MRGCLLGLLVDRSTGVARTRQVVRIDGRWSGEEIGAQAERIPT